MTTKEFILEQLKSTHNEKSWFVPFSDAVAGLTAEEAKRHDESGNHSVWQIVNHLIFWNGRWLLRLMGKVPKKMEGENSETFSGDSGTEQEWQASVQKLDKILSGFEEQLKNMDDEALKQEAFQGYGASWLDVFAQITTHNAYHIGQIVYIRKQHGTWNNEQGVK